MNFYEYLPHEYSYALYLADIYDLYPFDSMIHNMVSERYPRDEDEDSAADFDSAIDEDEALSHDVAMEVSASEAQSSTICNHICFGSFGNSDFSAVQFASITPIKPTIDGFTIKIGEIACVLVASSCNNKSAFAASEDDEKSKNLDSEIVVSEAIKGLNECKSEFGVSAEIKKSENLIKGRVPLCYGSVYGVAAIRPFASWFYVRKQKQQISSTAINNQVWLFELHDECIVDFDPGGIMLVISSSATMLSIMSIFDSISLFPFDPGGTFLCQIGLCFLFSKLILSIPLL
ncbi:unnamed protein product [Trifolium pratense]|uniref:Uncharacterized protein n=1 Tax=Trifolium pratense TaxID=57577 RepID=A0ACB0IB26_TRIPR|nr:unnamed protein product [Trifolium pratense]